jgi:hypothetical protein
VIDGCFTRYPEDLKWHPLLVNVDFILTQKALSKPLNGGFDVIDMIVDTAKKTEQN